MRGYFAFLIVFAAFALLISLVELNLNSKSHNLSAAIVTEKFYRVQMNVKEVLIEAARQGAVEGFGEYTATHNTAICVQNPNHPNCFKKDEAAAAAELQAMIRIQDAITADFDDDIDITVFLGTTPLTAKVVPDPSVLPNHFRLSSIELAKTSPISMTMTSEKDPEFTQDVSMPKIMVYVDERTSYS